MAAAFRPVNSPLAAEVAKEDVMTTTPSSPRPNTAPTPQPQPPLQSAQSPDDSKTPTRASFSTAMAGQKPLPTSPFPQVVQVPESAETGLRRDNGHRSKSPKRTLMDMDMDDSDGEAGTVEDGAGSDDESVNADGSRSHKKKKSQRFYCTDYPPCHLSFTRSEHLARHIRKHTGERPFQCHCSRRFSRLDNLRQHAQTVHVNEDIPIDSLAATGSRFQRQIRTERVRQAGNRARASTGGTAGGPVRGHSKSYSTSSIASIAAVGPTYTSQADPRRRPPPLVMAADSHPRLSLDSYRSNTDSTFSYRPQSPGDFSTPTSATFSTAQSSPRWGSGMVSPSSHSRSHSMYTMSNRIPGRRLSVPSGAAPFQFGQGQIPGRSTFGPLLNSSNSGAFSPPNSNLMSSPPMSTSGWPARRDTTLGTNDEAWRRRTWHPDSRSYNGNSSQLSVISQSVGPNPPPPIANPTNPQSTLRLPGIESFDPVPQRSITPPRRNLSPMVVDPESIPRHAIMEAVPSDERRNLNMYDVSLQRGLTRLDIGHKTPPRDGAGAWASEVNKAVLARAEHVRLNPPMVRFEGQPRPGHQTPNFTMTDRSLHQHTMSAPSLASNKDSKRHGWYHGPVTVHHEPVQQPQQESRGPHVDRMVHPNFNGFTGFPAREQPPHQQQRDRPSNSDPLRRLEALVAVATSEGSTATAY